MMTLRGRKTRKDQNGQRDNDWLVQLAQLERSHALHNFVSVGSLVECIQGARQRNEENFIGATVIDIMSGMLRRNDNQMKTYSQLMTRSIKTREVRRVALGSVVDSEFSHGAYLDADLPCLIV
jgi:hypothetical protein